MDKVIRDGQVAVLYSPEYGGGWYSSHQRKELVFHPVIVDLVEQDRRDEIDEELVCKLLNISEDDYPYIYDYPCISLSGAYDLKIRWVPEGSVFRIDKYDGYESVVLLSEEDLLTA